MKPLVAKTIEIAESHIGAREIGRSNRGKEVDRWLRQAGVSPGNPWCAGFTYGNKEDAAAALDVDNPFIRTAYTPDIFNWARERQILIPCHGKNGINKPQPGDDFLVMGPVRIYHTGHVQDVKADGWWAIEGNSNDEGSREGYEVARNFKPFASRFWWVRWNAIVPDVVGKPQGRKLYLGGTLIKNPDGSPLLLPVEGNITLVPVRKWARWMNGLVNWVARSDTPIVYNGRPLDVDITFIDGQSCVPIRVLAALDPTLVVGFDAKEQAVYVDRKKASK